MQFLSKLSSLSDPITQPPRSPSSRVVADNSPFCWPQPEDKLLCFYDALIMCLEFRRRRKREIDTSSTRPVQLDSTHFCRTANPYKCIGILNILMQMRKSLPSTKNFAKRTECCNSLTLSHKNNKKHFGKSILRYESSILILYKELCSSIFQSLWVSQSVSP